MRLSTPTGRRRARPGLAANRPGRIRLPGKPPGRKANSVPILGRARLGRQLANLWNVWYTPALSVIFSLSAACERRYAITRPIPAARIRPPGPPSRSSGSPACPRPRRRAPHPPHSAAAPFRDHPRLGKSADFPACATNWHPCAPICTFLPVFVACATPTRPPGVQGAGRTPATARRRRRTATPDTGRRLRAARRAAQNTRIPPKNALLRDRLRPNPPPCAPARPPFRPPRNRQPARPEARQHPPRRAGPTGSKPLALPVFSGICHFACPIATLRASAATPPRVCPPFASMPGTPLTSAAAQSSGNGAGGVACIEQQ